MKITLIHNASNPQGGGFNHDITAVLTHKNSAVEGTLIVFFAGQQEVGRETTDAQGRANLVFNVPEPQVVVTAQIDGGATMATKNIQAKQSSAPTQAVRVEFENASNRYADIGRNIVRIRTYRADNKGVKSRVRLNWKNKKSETITTNKDGLWEKVYELREGTEMSIQLVGYDTTDKDNVLVLFGVMRGQGLSPRMDFQEINNCKRNPSSPADHFRQGYSGQKPMPNNDWSQWLFFSFWSLLLGMVVEPVLTGTFFTPVLAGLSIIFLGLYGPGPEESRQMNIGYFLGWFWNTNNDKWRLSFIAFIFSLLLFISWGGFGIPQQKTVVNNPNPQTIQEQAEWNLRHHGFKGSDAEMQKQLGIKPKRELIITSKTIVIRDRAMALTLLGLSIVLLAFTIVYLPIAFSDEIALLISDLTHKDGTLSSVSETADRIAKTEVKRADGTVSHFGDILKAEVIVEIIKNIPRWLSKIR